MKTLKEICKPFNDLYGIDPDSYTDKNTTHSYLDVYENYFTTKRDNVKLLEIGMATGGSMHLWTHYFEKYHLEGVDIGASWRDLHNRGLMDFQTALNNNRDVHTHFNINSRSAAQASVVPNQFYDFVIDDGDHSLEAQCETFDAYYNKTAAGGVYFIEDISADHFEQLRSYVSTRVGSDVIIEEYRGPKFTWSRDDNILIIRRGSVCE